MAEFAFSRVGINPHYGKLFNPADLNVDCIPRGFSSGAEASVANGAALLGLDSDTGGSIRVPATLCGVVEFLSVARPVPKHSPKPLSTSAALPLCMKF